jgi:hypothetical protein
MSKLADVTSRVQALQFLRSTWRDDETGVKYSGEFATVHKLCRSVGDECITVAGAKVAAIRKTLKLPKHYAPGASDDLGLFFDLDSAVMRETFASSLVVRGRADSFCLVYSLQVHGDVVETLAEYGGATVKDIAAALSDGALLAFNSAACTAIAGAMWAANYWMPHTHADVLANVRRRFYQGDLHKSNVVASKVAGVWEFRIIDFFGDYTAYRYGTLMREGNPMLVAAHAAQLDRLFDAKYYAVADVCYFAYWMRPGAQAREYLATVAKFINGSLSQRRPELVMLRDLFMWLSEGATLPFCDDAGDRGEDRDRDRDRDRGRGVDRDRSEDRDRDRERDSDPEFYYRIVNYRFPYQFYYRHVQLAQAFLDFAVFKNHTQLTKDYDVGLHRMEDTYTFLSARAAGTATPVTLVNGRRVVVTDQQLVSLRDMFTMDGTTCVARRGWQCMYCGHVHVGAREPAALTCAQCFMGHAWLCRRCLYGNHDKGASACGDCLAPREPAAAAATTGGSRRGRGSRRSRRSRRRA